MSDETVIRLGAFALMLALMAFVEHLRPRRVVPSGNGWRWLRHLSLVALGTLLLRLLFPLLAVDLALRLQQQDWGLLSYAALPEALAIVLGVMILDLAIYLQHAMFHAIPALWRLHMVHHSDLHFDASTGVRFHPIEIVLSMGIKMAVVSAFGIHPLAVLIFELLLSLSSLFNHGNVAIPGALDRVLRWLLVTPDMHRVHHSVIPEETNSNFGFNLSCWDRLFGTYHAQPQAGHTGMTIGLRQFRQSLSLRHLLQLPWSGKTGDYPINRRDAQ